MSSFPLSNGGFETDRLRTQGDSQLCATVFPLLHRFGVELDAVWVARVTKTYLGECSRMHSRTERSRTFEMTLTLVEFSYHNNRSSAPAGSARPRCATEQSVRRRVAASAHAGPSKSPQAKSFRILELILPGVGCAAQDTVVFHTSCGACGKATDRSPHGLCARCRARVTRCCVW